MELTNLYYVPDVYGVTMAGIPYSLNRFLPDIDKSGIFGSSPFACDILFLYVWALRVYMTYRYDTDLLWTNYLKLYEPKSFVAYKSSIQELASFLREMAGRELIRADRDIYGAAPILLDDSSAFENNARTTPESNPDDVKDSLEDGDSIRSLYQDFSDYSRFLIPTRFEYSFDDVNRRFGKLGDGVFYDPVMGPHLSRGKKFAYYIDGVEREGRDSFSECNINIRWDNNVERIHLRTVCLDTLYVQINRAGSYDYASLLARYHYSGVNARLVVLYYVKGYGKANIYPTQYIAFPYTLKKAESYGYTLDAIDFMGVARALMPLYRQKFPQWYSERTEFALGVNRVYLDTGTLDNPLGLPEGWEFDRG